MRGPSSAPGAGALLGSTVNLLADLFLMTGWPAADRHALPVQVADDSDFFMDDQEDSAHTSEDSNAEGHYTHDYPEEGEKDSTEEAYSDAGDRSSRGSGSNDSDTW